MSYFWALCVFVCVRTHVVVSLSQRRLEDVCLCLRARPTRGSYVSNTWSWNASRFRCLVCNLRPLCFRLLQDYVAMQLPSSANQEVPRRRGAFVFCSECWGFASTMATQTLLWAPHWRHLHRCTLVPHTHARVVPFRTSEDVLESRVLKC